MGPQGLRLRLGRGEPRLRRLIPGPHPFPCWRAHGMIMRLRSTGGPLGVANRPETFYDRD